MLDKKRHNLFVEGADDKHVIASLVTKHVTPPPFEFDSSHIIKSRAAEKGEGDNFEVALEDFVTAIKNQKLERVGLVVDRDTPSHKRWEAVRERLLSVEGGSLAIPDTTPASGLLFKGLRDDVRCGVWMMPDNLSNGALEQFIESLVPTHQSVWAWSVEATKKARELAGLVAEKDISKAQLHAYLSWMESPGRPYGDAIRAGFLGHSSSAADAFVAWFRALFLA